MADIWARVGHQVLCLLTKPRPARPREQDEPSTVRPLAVGQGPSGPDWPSRAGIPGVAGRMGVLVPAKTIIFWKRAVFFRA